MNVFFLDRDPAVAARYHNDKHTVKMILEYAQLLSTAHRVLDGDAKGVLPDERNDFLYKRTHANHPSAVWVRRELDHYRWVHDLLYFLIGEYHYRYDGKKKPKQGEMFVRPHATERLLPYLLDAPHNIPVDGGFIMADPPQCMPDDTKADDTVTAYRQYYVKHKYHIAKWTRRDAPEWWNEATQNLSS